MADHQERLRIMMERIQNASRGGGFMTMNSFGEVVSMDDAFKPAKDEACIRQQVAESRKAIDEQVRRVLTPLVGSLSIDSVCKDVDEATVFALNEVVVQTKKTTSVSSVVDRQCDTICRAIQNHVPNAEVGKKALQSIRIGVVVEMNKILAAVVEASE